MMSIPMVGTPPTKSRLESAMMNRTVLPLLAVILLSATGCQDLSGALADASATRQGASVGSSSGAAEAGDDNGSGVEAGDDNGSGVEAGDDNGSGVEAGDDNGTDDTDAADDDNGADDTDAADDSSNDTGAESSGHGRHGGRA